MNDQRPKEYPESEEVQTQRSRGKSSWWLTAVFCFYLLMGGWAAYNFVPIFFALFAGLGLSVLPDSILFRVFLNYGWFIAAGVAFFVALVIAKRIGKVNERYLRIVNMILLIVAIGIAPMLLAAIAFTFLGPFSLIGKLAQ